MPFREWWRRAVSGQPTETQKSVGSLVPSLGVVWPAPHGNGWVDLPVENPATGGWTTAWSGQVPVLDPPQSLESFGLGAIDPQQIWKSQPAVRKVVDFIARAVASTPLKAYNRVSDDVRRLEGNSPLGQLLREPAPYVTPFRLWHATICDWLLYDRWAIMVVDSDSAGGFDLVRIPARRLRFRSDGLGRVTKIGVYIGDQNGTREPYRWDDPDGYIFDYGYTPLGAGGLTPMQTLSETLAERAEALRWRRQTWANGARLSGWIERPLEANELEGWDDDAERRFMADFESRYRGDGPDAGGAPLLKDGMKFHEARGFSASDMSDVEQRKLSDIEVTSAYHIAPELVGAREGNYSNVREYRSQLYRDALGGYFSPIKQAVNLMLVPRLAGRKRLYVDFDLDSKLRGSFEERAALTSTAVGAPWLTRNEARADENRPPIDGGDEIVTPLNVLVGEQPSPQTPTGDGGDDNVEPAEEPEPPKARLQLKATTIPDGTRDRLLVDFTAELDRFVDRQRRSIISAFGGKAALQDAWNSDRWNGELAATLVRHLGRLAELRAWTVGQKLDVEPDLAALALIVSKRADGISVAWNRKTYDRLAAVAGLDDWKTAFATEFEGARIRSQGLAVSSSTEVSSLAAMKATELAGPALKRWVVRSKSPRPSHASMAGEVVPVGESFSNGGRWPGDSTLPTAERARCTCDIEIEREG